MHRDRHVSLWPSVSVCSLIRPGNSIGPRSEGEQRYQMDSGRGVKIRNSKWTEKGRERERDRQTPAHKQLQHCQNCHERSANPNLHPPHPPPCTNPVASWQYDLIRIRIKRCKMLSNDYQTEFVFPSGKKGHNLP